MSAMFPERSSRSPLADSRGFGLIAAMFLVVILSLFGILAARYLSTTSVSSAEDYLWAQSLYAAESAAHRRILYHDGGGTGAFVAPVINRLTCTINNDNFNLFNNPSSVEASSFYDTNANGTADNQEVTRTIEIQYIL